MVNRKSPAIESSKGLESLSRMAWKKVIALGLAGAALVGVSACDNARAIPNDGETTSTSASANPSESSAATPSQEASPSSDPASTPEATPDLNMEVLEQTQTIEAMDAMTVEDFDALPYADRAAYLMAKIGVDKAGLPFPGEDFMITNPSMIPEVFWNQTTNNSSLGSTSEEKAKLLSALYSDASQNNQRYQSDVAVLMSGHGLSNNNVFVSASEEHIGSNSLGDKETFMYITFNMQDPHTGEIRSVQTARVAKLLVQTLDGEQFLVYPIDSVGPGTTPPPDNGYSY